MMTPEQKAEIDRLRAERQGSEEYPLLDPAQVAAAADRYRADELANRRAYREAFDEAGPVSQYMAGVGKPVMQLEAGLMSALGLGDDDYSREAKQAVTMLEEQHGLPATAGSITGDVALMALPAGPVARGAQAAVRGAPRIGQAAAVLAAESGLAGAIEGAKAPETGETRAENAIEAAKWTAALGVPFAGLASIPSRVTPQAKRLLDEGVRLTPGMAAGEKTIRRGTEDFMSKIPGLGGRVKKMQDVAIEDWNKLLLSRATPDGAIDDIGHEGFKQAQDRFTREYSDIWNSVTPDSFNLKNFDRSLSEPRAMLGVLDAADVPRAQTMLDVTEDYMLDFTETGRAGIIEQSDDVLRELAAEAGLSGNQSLADFYNGVRNAVRAGVGPEVSKRLTKTDRLYRDFKTVEHAAAYVKAQEAGAVINPRQLESAVKARNIPAQTTKGTGSMQTEAADATASIGTVLPGRSEISAGEDIGKWGTILGVAGTGGGAVVPLVAARGYLTEGARRYLTGAPLNQLGLTAQTMRLLREIGAKTINEIDDPIMREQVLQEAAAAQ